MYPAEVREKDREGLYSTFACIAAVILLLPSPGRTNVSLILNHVNYSAPIRAGRPGIFCVTGTFNKLLSRYESSGLFTGREISASGMVVI